MFIIKYCIVILLLIIRPININVILDIIILLLAIALFCRFAKKQERTKSLKIINHPYITLHYIIVIWQTLLSRATYIEVHKQNQGQVR